MPKNEHFRQAWNFATLSLEKLIAKWKHVLNKKCIFELWSRRYITVCVFCLHSISLRLAYNDTFIFDQKKRRDTSIYRNERNANGDRWGGSKGRKIYWWEGETGVYERPRRSALRTGIDHEEAALGLLVAKATEYDDPAIENYTKSHTLRARWTLMAFQL